MARSYDEYCSAVIERSAYHAGEAEKWYDKAVKALNKVEKLKTDKKTLEAEYTWLKDNSDENCVSYPGGKADKTFKLYEAQISDLEGQIKSLKSNKGNRGPRGKQGKQGLKGEVGATGKQGERGPKGEVGATGKQGERGPKGEVGSSSIDTDIITGVNSKISSLEKAVELDQKLPSSDSNNNNINYYLNRNYEETQNIFTELSVIYGRLAASEKSISSTYNTDSDLDLLSLITALTGRVEALEG